jgi:hypothetical protein
MLIGGFWHGAGWNFIAWGALHGLALVVDKSVLAPLPGRWGKGCAVAFTFHFVALMWLPFRLPSIQPLLLMLGKMAELNFAHAAAFWESHTLWCFLTVWGLSLHFLPVEIREEARVRFVALPWILKTLIFVVVVQIIVQLAGENVQPFIYFQF